MHFVLEPEIRNAFPSQDKLFDQIMQLQGAIFRELENRRTQRIKLGTNYYFIKLHFGVGWKEIFKNLFQLRLPIISAKNEWRAIKALHPLNIPTLETLGYGERGFNPATRQSFLITRELPPFVTLEDLCKNWTDEPPSFKFKLQLIREVARIARLLHENGINHRDFYICHFLLDLTRDLQHSLKIYLIDLHRAQIRRRTPLRWVIKDLSGLYFSTMNIGLTQRDVLRFIKYYRNTALHTVLPKEQAFWLKVKKRGDKLYQKHDRSYQVSNP